ncbi:hypothetical protein MOTC310_29235 [Methylobacterium oryzae]|uniref:Uncharacterized protein n=1 Tax=Methylobacterium oryzae TaxID=334852 RepID=A0ABU7TX65_9HYPH
MPARSLPRMPLVLGPTGRPRDSGEIAEAGAGLRPVMQSDDQSGDTVAAGCLLLKTFQSGSFAT